MTALAGLLQPFFTERLQRQRAASPNTIAAYRDTFRLLLAFAQQRLRKLPSALEVAELDASLITAFLDSLERTRGNSVRTRNARLAAIHSFFRFVVLEEPALSATCQRVLAIPSKKATRTLITALSQPESAVLLAAPDRATWLGRRDYALLLLSLQTGLRVSEVCALRRQDVVLTTGPHVRCVGKGRKERCTPLTGEAVLVLRTWLAETAAAPDAPLFPGRRGGHLSRDAVERLVTKHVARAGANGTTLRTKHVTPHVLRHTTAVTLLHAGIDRATIALWLGHESVETTQMYLDADLTAKERALACTAPLGAHNRVRGIMRFMPRAA
ncbi:MAG: site-specific integrase [Gemmatimonadales bacterium]|nr:site-specific integrase [Gemmatimonadales bacterium]